MHCASRFLEILLCYLGADYLLVVVVAVVLSGANVVGYTKCSKQASAQLKSYAQQAVTSGLTVRIATCFQDSQSRWSSPSQCEFMCDIIAACWASYLIALFNAGI